MTPRNHDPTETNLPVFSTTSTLRDTLEDLKTEKEFHIIVEIGGETDGGGSL